MLILILTIEHPSPLSRTIKPAFFSKTFGYQFELILPTLLGLWT